MTARRPATRTQGAAAGLATGLDECTGLDSSGSPAAPAPPLLASRRDRPVIAATAKRSVQEIARPAAAPVHTDFLFHHLRVAGPVEDLAAFRAAASGAGIIPWHLDLDRVEEDAFLRLAAPIGHARTLSLEGARLLAAELRDAVGRRHALAVARVGLDKKCCFDLHALVPVPGDVLRLGPDHPEALHWLWTRWGTTDALRRVAPAPDRDETALAETAWRISFWSADWTPWRALASVRRRFPGLRFDLQPHYERG